MMMNMITGAVVINGGVGVMEVRQPQMVEKAVQDAGHIAADIAENAHITLHELKEKIDAVLEKKLPSFKALMEMQPMAVARIVTQAKKQKTEKQLRKWLADPYSDAAEYKLWGNGVALPCVYFVLAGIAWCAGLEE